MAAGAAAGGAAAAAIQAIRASGVVVRIEPTEFLRLLQRQDSPLVVRASRSGLFGTWEEYLNSYKGLAFYTWSSVPLHLPIATEIVEAGRIWVPG
jgi:hypothetical protein